MLYLKFAWRNLWRNSRRTLITVASVFFGVFFANNISHYTQRVESFALACSNNGCYASMIFGIIPQEEDSISEISKWISKGRIINPQTNEVIIGKDLADNLKIGINDTLVLLGQGYHGVSAAGLFPVVGLLDFPISQMGFEPKLVFSIQPEIFINPAITVFVIFGVLTLYPF